MSWDFVTTGLHQWDCTPPGTLIEHQPPFEEAITLGFLSLPTHWPDEIESNEAGQFIELAR